MDGRTAEWASRVRRIEALGYGAGSISDHLIGGWSMDVFVSLAAAAMATTELRLLSLVLANDYRHPVLVHRAVAAIDVLSGGRAEIGIGTGWLAAEYEALGLPLDPPEVRVERLAESVELIQALFKPEPVTRDGAYYRIRGLVGAPTPVQRPHPPLLIGGGTRRILELAGRVADIAGIFPPRDAASRVTAAALSPDMTARRVSHVRAAANAAGRPSGAVRLQLSVLAYDLTGADGTHAVGRSSIVGEGLIEAARETDLPGVLVGTIDDASDRLEGWRERYGFSEIHVGSDVEAFAPIVERLAGR
jgi:probable F420-dependent oxidoreductase